ncbi:MAG: L-serine ammonia-lyase, partial [Pseudomonadales bacterium]
MDISVFDLFKIGVGPSSSHTMGPMKAAAKFTRQLQQQCALESISRIQVTLFGSLSATGKGHGTDRACLAGLMGFEPHEVEPDLLSNLLDVVAAEGKLRLASEHSLAFDFARDMLFSEESLPFHPNGMTLVAFSGSDSVYENTYYSVGGGFVVEDAQKDRALDTERAEPPHPFESAASLLEHCEKKNLSVSQLVLENEMTWRTEAEVKDGLASIWQAMDACVERGLVQKGRLPGGLDVPRRAEGLHRSLETTTDNLISSTFHAMDWVNLYALAVNEENAAGGRVVTAPTNGAAGIVPAVLRFYMRFSENPQPED